MSEIHETIHITLHHNEPGKQSASRELPAIPSGSAVDAFCRRNPDTKFKGLPFTTASGDLSFVVRDRAPSSPCFTKLDKNEKQNGMDKKKGCNMAEYESTCPRLARLE